MSSDTHSDVPARVRCEPISSSLSSTLSRRYTVGAILNSFESGRVQMLADDPALLIGLALCHVRQQGGMVGTLPDTIMSRLQEHAAHGDPTCCLVMDWLVRRNGDVADPYAPDATHTHSSEVRLGRRLIKERRQAGPGSLQRRKPSRDGSLDTEAAIIAALREGESDE
ncbi:hypothetical protein RMR16_013580 [Agrobacterium sp. rho-13.3]|uniref:hypothetical protein n=1 Tax=Agrobacterium sp. rho-13.3 TaxID=3072980 RepID=UPI002A108610|nr:hypothetical protein [Agrobacterium sp. rho-13.3]MDX8309904.1 hypothetical protein [Agrobacterium sp. rho-13.3]